MSDRAQRQAEIAAMMASLDEAPTYTKFDAKQDEDNQTTIDNHEKSGGNTLPTSSIEKQSNSKEEHLIEKHKLPIHESTTRATTESDSKILTIAMDPSGARFALGSMDSSLRLYDFGGLNPDNPAPFQNVFAQEGYPVRSIAYAPSGDRCVVATGSIQPRIMDRDGSDVLLEFVRGDVYVTDPTKTIGHTAAVTCVQWNPLEKSIVYTTSRDGSLRMWNVDHGKLAFGMLKAEDIIVIKGLRSGKKTIPTCMSITHKFIAIGTTCGSIQIYGHPFKSKLRPQQSTIVQLEGNPKPSPVTSLIYSMDGSRLACRTTDAVLVYNSSKKLASSTTPLLVCRNVGVNDDDDNSTPTMAFSPSGKLLCVGVTEHNIEDGKIRSKNRLDFYLVPKEGNVKKRNRKPSFSKYLSGSEESIVGISWHSKLNQILVAMTKSFCIWYSMDFSTKGVLLNLSANRRVKRKMEEELQEMYQAKAPPPGSNVRYDDIVALNALPMFGGDSKQKRKQRKMERQEEDNKRQNPQQPSKSVYNTSNTIFAQLVVDNQTADQKVIAGKDPREALAKYSEGKSYIGTAYEGNKERILADRTVEEEEDEMKKK